MFVSSYNTYIAPSNSERNSRVTQERERESKNSFSDKLFTTVNKTADVTGNLKINYVLSSKTFGNKQELEFQQLNLQNGEKNSLKELSDVFTKQNTLNSAKDAYANNSKMFSLLLEPKATLGVQAISSDAKEPKDIQELKEKYLRNTMVNTYQANEKYYLITA